MTALDAAIAWIRRGFSPVPIPHRSKKPVLEGWQRLEITPDTAPRYFNSPSQNIGVLLGDKFGSTDVDCDCAEAIAAARVLLPLRPGWFLRLGLVACAVFYIGISTIAFHQQWPRIQTWLATGN